MGKIIVAAAMSVDGYVADPTDAVGPLFDWYGNGDVAISANPAAGEFHLTRASADHLGPAWANMAATMIGRRLFDLTDGWHGIPAAGERVFVVTHRPAPPEWLERFPDAPFTFVTDGVAAAVAQARAFAGDRDVVVTAGDLGGQVVAAGLADEVDIAQVPVVFGAGVRFFGGFAQGPLLLENPTVVEGDRVTHLRYRVRRPS
jgi:dihydrofolate reductase